MKSFLLIKMPVYFYFSFGFIFYLKQVHRLDPSEQKTLKGAGVAAKLWISFSNFFVDILTWLCTVTQCLIFGRTIVIKELRYKLSLSLLAGQHSISLFLFFLIGRYLVACVISSARTRNDLSLSRLSRLVLYTAYAKRPVGWMSRLDPARRRRRRRRLRTLGRALMTRSPCALLPPLAETNSWGERLRHITHMTRRSDCETTTTILFYI